MFRHILAAVFLMLSNIAFADVPKPLRDQPLERQFKIENLLPSMSPHQARVAATQATFEVAERNQQFWISRLSEFEAKRDAARQNEPSKNDAIQDRITACEKAIARCERIMQMAKLSMKKPALALQLSPPHPR